MRGARRRTALAAEDAVVMGDRVQLQQVLLNLIMNGAEAMRGVTERARELTISSRLDEPSGVPSNSLLSRSSRIVVTPY